MSRSIVVISILLSLAVLSSTAQRSGVSLPPVTNVHGERVDVVQMSHARPVIAIRFLGAICSHCMEQIVQINSLAATYKASNARVIVFSEDPIEKCRETIAEYHLDTTLITMCNDSANRCSRALGTTITETDGSITELHAFLVLDQGRVVFEKYSTSPMMALQAVLDLLATLPRRKSPTAP
jgi:peroxiredoxin